MAGGVEVKGNSSGSASDCTSTLGDPETLLGLALSASELELVPCTPTPPAGPPP